MTTLLNLVIAAIVGVLVLYVFLRFLLGSPPREGSRREQVTDAERQKWAKEDALWREQVEREFAGLDPLGQCQYTDRNGKRVKL